MAFAFGAGMITGVSGCDALDIEIALLDAPPGRVREAAALLSADELRRADRFRCDREHHRFIVCRARLRELLGERLNVPADTIEFTYGAAGKPALGAAFGDVDVRFNVSHAGGVGAFVFTIGCDVGIDIEVVRTLPEADAIAKLVFSSVEFESYCSLPPQDRLLGFFNGWTRKEAFVKAIGDGLRHPLERFDVSLAPGEPARVLRIDGVPATRCGWELHAFVPGAGLIGAVAVRTAVHISGIRLPSRNDVRTRSRCVPTTALEAHDNV